MSENIADVKKVAETEESVTLEMPDGEKVEVDKKELADAGVKTEAPEEQPAEEMLADLEAIDKKKHPNKQKPEAPKKDLIDRATVIALIEPRLGRVRRNGVTMPTREVLALVNGLIADIKEIKGE